MDTRKLTDDYNDNILPLLIVSIFLQIYMKIMYDTCTDVP